MNKALAAWLLVAVASAGAVTPPQVVVQRAVTQLIAVFQETPDADRITRADFLEKRRAEIRRIAAETFDFDEMARRALGRYWSRRTAAQRGEFVELFTGLLERSYMGRIESYVDERIVFLGEAIDGGYATVRSRIVSPRHVETTLDYRLSLTQGRWRVFDLSVDGVSFVGTYRSEFARVINTSSYESLVERMRKKRLEIDALSRRREPPDPSALPGDRRHRAPRRPAAR
ncbi:MAG: ABC transporter substrate-binding protein [Candidatus Rokubacteria bacterium]|nr:ABC transporter substrate-binding protein [Candidatus Rokubacteria bacterium]